LPVRKACIRGHIAIVEHLLACGAGTERTIEFAATWGHTKLVERLLELGISPTGGLPKAAAAAGYIDIVRALLEVGVDPNETFELVPKHPLVSAIAYEHTNMFTLLVERGADLHADGVAKACVHCARKDGLDSMLLLLQAHGVDVAGMPYKEDPPK
jgi:ankyrin repeat protein